MDTTYALIQEYVRTGDADALRVLDDWMEESRDDGRRVAQIIVDEMEVMSAVANAQGRRESEYVRRLAQAAAVIFLQARRAKLKLAKAATWGFTGYGFAFKIEQDQNIDQLKDVRRWWRRVRGSDTKWSTIIAASAALRFRRSDGSDNDFSEFLAALEPLMQLR